MGTRLLLFSLNEVKLAIVSLPFRAPDKRYFRSGKIISRKTIWLGTCENLRTR
jgi:hypothetical protein